MFYFFKTMMESGRQRLRPLSGQKFPDGKPVNNTWNVQSDKELRSMYPIGTIFGADNLEVRDEFYSAKNLYPLGIRDDEYKSPSHRPNEAMVRSYEVFIGATAESEWKEAEERTTTKSGTLLAKMMANKDYQVPDPKKGFYVDGDNWYLLIRNILNQVNTMLIGPTGTGKTELVMRACKCIGVPCRVYDMGSMYDPVAGLLGVHRLAEGRSIFDYAKFAKDIQEPGVILLDELSRAPVTTNNILFPCLDGRRMLPCEIAGGDDLRCIKVHPECTFIATANVGAEYTGTMSMDRALVCRFFPLELGYMPSEMEKDILTKRCGIAKTDATYIVNVANNVRNLYLKQEISSSLSTRETLMTAELVADGWGVLRAMEMVYLPLFEGTSKEGERSIVKKVIAAH